MLGADGRSVTLDARTRKKLGRGAYVHLSPQCLRKAVHVRLWKRALRTQEELNLDAVARVASDVVDGGVSMKDHARGSFLRVAGKNTDGR